MVFRIYLVNEAGEMESLTDPFATLPEALNYMIDRPFDLEEGEEVRIVPTMLFDGEFNGKKGTGEFIEMYGFAVATVIIHDTKGVLLQSVEIFFDLDEFLALLNAGDPIPLEKEDL